MGLLSTSIDMNGDPPSAPDNNEPAKNLIRLLGQIEHVKDLVEECAAELSSANGMLKNELAGSGPLPRMEIVLKKSGAVEEKVQDVAEKLSVVNRALQHEVLERQVLAHQLADVMEQENAAYHAAFHDPLTGLPNRALFHDRLEHGLAQAKRHGWMLSVLFVDLDDFKIINDSHGHHVGDDVLKTVARRLQEVTRVDDTICRHGGDEFLCLLLGTQDEKTVAQIAEKMILAIQAPTEGSTGEPSLRPNIRSSIGISMYPKDGTTAATLVKSADLAMYRAKRDKCGYAFAE